MADSPHPQDSGLPSANQAKEEAGASSPGEPDPSHLADRAQGNSGRTPIMPSDLPTLNRGKPGSRRRYFYWISGLVLLGALGVGAVVGGRSVQRRWENRQAWVLAQEARADLDAERWEEASKRLGEAYLKSPQNIDVVRGIFDLIKRTNPNAERQLYFLRQIVASGQGTLADRVDMAECHLALRQFDEARGILDAFTLTDRQGRYGLELQAHLLRAEGKSENASALYRQAWLLAPDDPESRLKLASMDLRNPFREIQERAVGTIWELARARDRWALSAMELLCNETKLTSSQAKELWQLVNDHPFAPPRRRLMVLGAYIKVHPQEKESLVEGEAHRLEGKPIEDRMDFLRWLATTGDHERFLKIVPKEKAVLTRELFPPYVEALAAAGRWDELQVALKNSASMPLGPSEKALLQARMAKGLGEPAKIVRGYLQEACRHAAGMKDYRGLLRGASFAESEGYQDIALEGYRAAANASRDPAIMERVLQLEQRQQNPEAILSTVEKLLQSQPAAREHWATALYLKMLLGREMEVTVVESRKLLAEDRLTPNAARFIEALAAFREMDPDRLKHLLADVDAESLPMGQRAVLAGLLSDCGEAARAFAIAEQISSRLLLKEEEAYLKRAL